MLLLRGDNHVHGIVRQVHSFLKEYLSPLAAAFSSSLEQRQPKILMQTRRESGRGSSSKGLLFKIEEFYEIVHVSL